MIFRALIRLATLATLAAAGWWVAKAFRGAGRRRDSAPPGGPPAQGPMVRDRECNTFLPRERAIELRVVDETHFFCSETCRDRFLERSGNAEPA